jgi:hypothetical protein
MSCPQGLELTLQPPAEDQGGHKQHGQQDVHGDGDQAHVSLF